MNQRLKLLESVRNNPTGVRFADACKVAEMLGYAGSQPGSSHRSFSKPGDPVGLNFQNRNGYIKPYQARQLIAAIDKYEGEL